MCFHFHLKYKNNKTVLLAWSKNREAYVTVGKLYHYTPSVHSIVSRVYVLFCPIQYIESALKIASETKFSDYASCELSPVAVLVWASTSFHNRQKGMATVRSSALVGDSFFALGLV